jgi:hypothetical protein
MDISDHQALGDGLPQSFDGDEVYACIEVSLSFSLRKQYLDFLALV